MLGGLNMEHKIGEIFKYNNTKLKCIEYYPNSNHCNDCYFYEIFGPCDTILCSRIERKDHKDVIFKKV